VQTPLFPVQGHAWSSTGRPDILPGEVPGESMGIANTCERLGERHSQWFSIKEDLYSLGNDGWNQVVCISGDLSRKSYWVEGGFQACHLG
jgi:hypothetical protein